MTSPDGGTLGGLLGAHAAGAAPPQPMPDILGARSAITDVYDTFCAQQAEGRAFCPTLGRCFDPLTEVCRAPGYIEPPGLSSCVRGAQARCRFTYSGPANDACSEGAVQGARVPTLTTQTDLRSMLLFPKAFADGMALSNNLCTNMG